MIRKVPKRTPLLCVQECDNECNPQQCDLGNFDLAVFDETDRDAIAQQQDQLLPIQHGRNRDIYSLPQSEQLRFSCFGTLAGCGFLTTSGKQRGWTCAPPIDILINADYNLLNVCSSLLSLGVYWRAESPCCTWGYRVPLSAWQLTVSCGGECSRWVCSLLTYKQIPGGGVLPGQP